MENPAEVGRWVKAQRQRKGWSAQELADRARGFAAVEEGVTLKLTQQSVSNFELGEAKRLPVWLRYIHKAFSAADGETREDTHLTLDGADTSAMIELLPTFVGAGGGGTGEGDRSLRAVSGSLLDQLGVRPGDVLMIEIEGDLMEPQFRSGDQMLVDKRRQSIAQPGAFCLWDGDGYVVKYLEKVPGTDPPKVRVISGNQRYSAWERLADEVQVMGRIVWFGRRV